MTPRNTIIVVVTAVVVVGVAAGLTVWLLKKKKSVCGPNTLCETEACDEENPLAGNWRLVGGAKRDTQVFDGDQIFQFYNGGVNADGVTTYISTANAFDTTPVLLFRYSDEFDGSGNRVVTIHADARIYAKNYQDFEVNDPDRMRSATMRGGDVIGGTTGINRFSLPIHPPNASGCIRFDTIDFNALCEAGTQPTVCLWTDMPLFLERVE